MKYTPMVAFAMLCAAPALSQADEVTLKNDKLVNITNPMAPQLDPGEKVAESFNPPANYYPFDIVGVEYIAVSKVGDGGSAHLKVSFYADTGQSAPGKLLVDYAEPEVLEGHTQYAQTLALPTPYTVTSGGVRVAMETDNGLQTGGISWPVDNSSPPGNHGSFCYNDPLSPGSPCKWTFNRVGFLGQVVNGTWPIRLIINTAAVSNPDMGGGNGGADMSGVIIAKGAPTITSITPSSFNEGSGGTAVILGSNFVAGAGGTTVALRGQKGIATLQSVLIDSTTSMTVQIPNNLAADSYDVVLQNVVSGMPLSATLPRGLTINGGKGCSAGGGDGAGLWPLSLLLMGGLLLRQRRRAGSLV